MLRVLALCVLIVAASAASLCKDNDQGVIAKAKETDGTVIGGCSDVKEYCNHGEYGPIVQSFCPKTCNTCKKIVVAPPPAPAPPASGTAVDGWQCPSAWTTGDDGSGVPDAKAYTAIHNVLRCVHNTPAVQWDGDVYASAKGWAAKMGSTMHHSTTGSDRPADTGENLAGATALSKHPGVDSSHMWYSEIFEPCKVSASCYQSFAAGHMTAMIWKDVRKIAYALTPPSNDDYKKEIAVGRYKVKAGGQSPNMEGQYAEQVPEVVNTYADCYKTVTSCSAFSGATDLEGCDGMSKATWDQATGALKWFKAYKSDCGEKYKALKFDASWPEVVQSHIPSSPIAVVLSFAFLAVSISFIAVRLVRRRRATSESSTHGLIATHDDDSGLE